MSRVAFGLMFSFALFACGRTEPVRYSFDGGNEDGDFAARKPDGGVDCIDGELALLSARPVVMLVLDRSSSMNQNFAGTGDSKWDGLRTALHQALPPWTRSIELGALFFPSVTSNACNVGVSVDLAPALENVPAVLAKLDAASPAGSTPTALALDRAAVALTSRRTAGSARAVVLATDGAPDCNAALNPRTCACVSSSGACTANRCLDDTRTIGRLSTMAASGIPTWIIGLRGDSDALFVSVLNRMAEAGGKPRVGGTQQFYSASSESEVELALTTIRQQVGRCRYLTPSAPDLGGSIELQLEGDLIPYDLSQTEGWSWVDADNGELALHGRACDRAEALTIEALRVIVRCAL
ncbi:MAG: vWA domain-containing protein [Archangium sp.]|nr:vWA domain-containing protein [Archangium sp.]